MGVTKRVDFVYEGFEGTYAPIIKGYDSNGVIFFPIGRKNRNAVHLVYLDTLALQRKTPILLPLWKCT